MLVFGPVPSRRLGQSIGINNIPPKTCSYSCVYCQIGRTNKMSIVRSEFYKPEDILLEAENKLEQLSSENRNADYFSFVPDGEPTLDVNLGRAIRLLKPLGVKIAVITNASLLWMEDVRSDLMAADWVSVSVDAADDAVWRRIDRPHRGLDHKKILAGMVEFSNTFPGTLVTETMLLGGVNDHESCVERIAEQIALIRPERSYVLAPTRPPSESNINRPCSESLGRAAAIIRAISGSDVECITGSEEDEGFFISKDIAEDLLGIASVHPIREDIVYELLRRRQADVSVIKDLLDSGRLQEYIYEGRKFFKSEVSL